VFTDVDGDVVFCLASGEGGPADRFTLLQVQTIAARVVADAIRDAVGSSVGD
jgi:L-aminopeptidase/D-esterase-like protein